MSKQIAILATMLFLPFSAAVKADCVPFDLSLDTLAPGIVHIAVAENTSYEYIDTATEQKLLDTLRYLYARNENVVIARIDSVFRAGGGTGWGDDSIIIAIDTVLKGAPSFRTIRFQHQKWEDSRDFDDLIDSLFIAFFDNDSLPPFLGLGAPSYCSDTWGNSGATGFNVSSGEIAHKGYGAMLGVSVPLSEFLDATLASGEFVRNRETIFWKRSYSYGIAHGIQKNRGAAYDVRGRNETNRRCGLHIMIQCEQ
jgi:hypothetical protein